MCVVTVVSIEWKMVSSHAIERNHEKYLFRTVVNWLRRILIEMVGGGGVGG